MPNIVPFLKQLITLPGLSGYESPAREVIAERWRPLVDEISVSKLGSLHALKRASGSPQGSVLLAAHMDAIGLMVTGYRGSLLSVTEIGGIDARILPGQMVTVHGKHNLPGIATLQADRLVKADHKEKVPVLERIFVDTGLSENEIKEAVEVGSLVSFASPATDMAEGFLSGHSLDNRASVAAVTLCLQELGNLKHQWDVWAVATVQEEETLGGASTSAFEIKPDLAIVIDVTFGKGPGASDYRAFPLGKGITIAAGANIHPWLAKHLKSLADEAEIPYAIEVLPKSSGTDAVNLQITGSGVPCEVIGIPLRYMHTPIEEVALADIENAGKLLAKFISSLNADTMNSLRKEMME
jgi:putative aminopeptidase FrvX